jgi:trk system potassium uptake protein TrkA
MKIVILGCSRVGAMLATELAKNGNEVAVIDSREGSFVRLPKDAEVKRVLGMGVEHDVLKKAGIEEANVFLALTNSDNTNLTAAQLVKHTFKVPRVASRVYDVQRAKSFEGLNLNVICPTVDTVEKFKEFLKSE